MQEIPLQAIPNQSFTAVLENSQWAGTLKTTNGVTSITLELNNVTVIENLRTVANQLIIPARYQEAGNFVFLTQNFELPTYAQFGVTQILVYLTEAELAAARTPPPVWLTEADFNPIAALPLRFAPEGYTLAP